MFHFEDSENDVSRIGTSIWCPCNAKVKIFLSFKYKCQLTAALIQLLTLLSLILNRHQAKLASVMARSIHSQDHKTRKV